MSIDEMQSKINKAMGASYSILLNARAEMYVQAHTSRAEKMPAPKGDKKRLILKARTVAVISLDRIKTRPMEFGVV